MPEAGGEDKRWGRAGTDDADLVLRDRLAGDLFTVAARRESGWPDGRMAGTHKLTGTLHDC